MSGFTSGYITVFFGWKKRVSVRAIPRTMPEPGIRAIRPSLCRQQHGGSRDK